MTCNKAQDAVMLYHEKRITPYKSIALHHHVNKCEDCRELFLAMNEAAELNTLETAPEDLIVSVMAIIKSTPLVEMKEPSPLPGLEDVASQQQVFSKDDSPPAPKGFNLLRLAGGLYALILAVGLALVYNTGALELANIFFGHLAQTGQTMTSFAADMAGDFVNRILIIAVALILTAIGIDTGKKTEA